MANPKPDDPQARKPVSQALREDGATVSGTPKVEDTEDLSRELDAAVGGGPDIVTSPETIGTPNDPQARQPVTEALREKGATIRSDPDTIRQGAMDPLPGGGPDINPPVDNEAPKSEQDTNSDGVKDGGKVVAGREVDAANRGVAGDSSLVASDSTNGTAKGQLIARRDVPYKHTVMNHEELVTEVRGWPAAHFVGNHPLANPSLTNDDALRQYLAYLNEWAAEGKSVYTSPPMTIDDFVNVEYQADPKIGELELGGEDQPEPELDGSEEAGA